MKRNEKNSAKRENSQVTKNASTGLDEPQPCTMKPTAEGPQHEAKETPELEAEALPYTCKAGFTDETLIMLYAAHRFLADLKYMEKYDNEVGEGGNVPVHSFYNARREMETRLSIVIGRCIVEKLKAAAKGDFPKCI